MEASDAGIGEAPAVPYIPREFIATNKRLLVRTRGMSWDLVPDEQIGEYCLVHVFGKLQKYFVRINDLDGRRIRVVVYERRRLS